MINKLIAKIQKTKAPIVVGLDPMLSYIPEHIQKKAFEELYAHNFKDGMKGIPCFYCRGAWNEAGMSLPDRTLCHLLMKSVEKKDRETLEPWERALADAAGKSCDWTERKYLEPLLDFLRS